MEPDHQSVYTVVKLTIVQLILGTDQETTEKSQEIHQMHLKTGATGENLALAARNQTGSTHHNTNKTPFSHIDGRGQNQPNGGPPQIST